MKFPINQLLVGYGMFALSLTLIIILLWQFRKALSASAYTGAKQKNLFIWTCLGVIAWCIYLAVISFSGVLIGDGSGPPRVALVVLPPLLVILFLTLTGRLDEILIRISPKLLIGLQTFRIIVELLLWQSFINGYTPVQMTFEGRNWDVLTGLTAPFAAWFVLRQGKLNRFLLITWNLFGIGLLVNIVMIAVLSFPSPIRVFMNEPSSSIVAYFPFVYLPGILVVMAYTLHILSLRQEKLKPAFGEMAP